MGAKSALANALGGSTAPELGRVDCDKMLCTHSYYAQVAEDSIFTRIHTPLMEEDTEVIPQGQICQVCSMWQEDEQPVTELV